MNRRLSLCLLAMLGSVSVLQPAGAQTPAPAGSPTTMASGIAPLRLDQSQAPDIPAQQAMQAFITGNLGVITGGMPSEQSKARDAIVNAMPHKSSGNVAVAYVDAYAKILDDALVKLLKTNPPLRVKLLVGVIAAKAAEHAEDASTPLSGTAEVLLQDQAESSLLWGMKTAKYVMPSKLNGAPIMYKSLLDRIVPIASAHPGPVLEEAYQALTMSTLNLATTPKLLNDASVMTRVKIVIPQVHALLAKRVADWNAGEPKDPTADTDATLFLSIPGVWQLQTPPQQKQTVTDLHDVLSKATPAFTASPAGSHERDELRQLISRVASALSAIGSYVGDTQLQGAAQQLSKITTGTNNAMATDWMQSVSAAVSSMQMMKGAVTGGPTTQTSIAPVGQAALTK